jgi:diguanylate cyclase (GGDEF)-like protein
MEAVSANFDLETMLLVNGLTSILSIPLLLTLVVNHQDPVQRYCLRIWALANALLTLGFGLLLAPIADIGFVHMASFANLAIDAGTALGLVATNASLGRPMRANWPLGFAVAIGLVQLGYVLFVAVEHDWVLMLLGCILRAAITLATGWALWFHADAPRRVPARLAAAFHLLWVVLLGLRSAALLAGETSMMALEGNSIVGLIGRFMLTWVIAICLLWMTARQLDEQLIHHATRDPLTGLFNRRVMWEAGMARGSKPTALILLDIDYFKMINDRWGHGAGDEMLALVARRIEAEVRTGDIVSRVGGEEFMVLPAATHAEHVAAMAERIRAAVAAASLTLEDGKVLQCTVSIGHACDPGDGVGWNRLVAEADAALYAAKHGGRNRVVAHILGEPTRGGATDQNARVMPNVAALRA